jgi:hypothetical protein
MLTTDSTYVKANATGACGTDLGGSTQATTYTMLVFDLTFTSGQVRPLDRSWLTRKLVAPCLH